uniref:CRM-domain containing factor CFM3, chloroplastic/mitochondrial n=1 Tax=Leersia perrieri TaxID=77586 RepID=A0A0D9W5X7_9ORYZ
MLLLFLPNPSPPLLLSHPSAASRTRPLRLPPIHASPSSSPSPELLAKSALRRISDKLRSLGYLETDDDPEVTGGLATDASPGEIFVPNPAQLPRHRVGSTLDPSWATGDGEAAESPRGRGRRGGGRGDAAAPPSPAELALPRGELRRLQGIGIRMRMRLKVGKPGVTEGIVNGIHERWRNAELVKIRCDDVSAMNMKRTHEILERKTGGLVIWRSGSTIILYRGTDYKYPYFHDREKKDDMDESSEDRNSGDKGVDIDTKDAEQSSSYEDAENPAEHGSNHPEMGGDLGGTLLSRDNESIVFYRGKDFLPTAISLAIEKRRKHGNSTISSPKLVFEERTLLNSSELKMATDVSVDGFECYEVKHKEETPVSENRAESLNVVAQNVEARLSQAIEEKEKTEKLIEELEKSPQPSRAETRETISEEERYMLRKVGLKMKSFLLLGRRGVFDGTVENMHLHWKYRELVKIICKEHSIKDVEYAARTLEAESGGILVAVERVSKAHAIIIYRGKNYQRPSTLRPKSLLNKRNALKRSVEHQRYKSLKLHVLNLSKNIDYLRGQMEVPEFLPECPASLVEECSPGESETEGTLDESGVPLDVMQNKLLCFNKLTDDPPETASSSLTGGTSTSSDNLIKHQSRHSSSVTPNSDGSKVGDLKSVGTLTPVHEPKLEEKFASHLPFTAAPLSNRERLMLRKQALKMKKRPVLAIGRNNVITGVAKTIKTHFKKHPLAIVNIKNRADGTPIQQLISELEEATGSVLVSRETNKVILYRGWGAEVAQNSSNGSGTEQVEEEVISPQLLEAIRLECGLHPGESD